MGKLGLGIGDPGQRCKIDPRRQSEQGIADDDSRVIGGQMRELRPADDIANGVNSPVARPEAPIDSDALS